MSEPGTPSEQTPNKSEGRQSKIIPLYAGLLLVTLPVIIAYGILKYITARPPHQVTTSEIVGAALAITASVICVVVGMRIMLRDASAPRFVIPPEDRILLEGLIKDGNEKGIDQYIRLSSLLGTTGTATKLGLTGLPLATVGLTIFFSIAAVYRPADFLDLAKLTLGAFIGSFVQRNVTNEKAATEGVRTSAS